MLPQRQKEEDFEAEPRKENLDVENGAQEVCERERGTEIGRWEMRRNFDGNIPHKREGGKYDLKCCCRLYEYEADAG